MNRLLSIVLFALLAVPVSAILTFLLIPVWKSFEANSAIESIGHSGPATWCYGAVYVLTLAVGLLIRRMLR